MWMGAQTSRQSTHFETLHDFSAPNTARGGLRSPAKGLGELSVTGTIKKAEPKYSLTEDQYAEFVGGKYDNIGLEAYKCSSVYIKNLNRQRGIRYDSKATNKNHTFVEDAIRSVRKNPGPHDYHVQTPGDLQTKVSKIRNAMTKAPRVTSTQQHLNEKSFIPGPDKYDHEAARQRQWKICGSPVQ